MGDIDRNAILARRALFVSTALAGLSCTTHEAPATQAGDKTDKTEQTTKVEAPPSTHQNPTAAPTRQRPSWDEVMAAAPPIDVPEGVSGHEREMLQDLARGVTAKYEQLHAVWEITPDCAPTRSECVAWSKAVEAMLEAWPDHGPLCGVAPDWTDTLEQRGREHDDYLIQLRELLLVDLDAAAKHWSEPDAVAWAGLRVPLEQGPPRPCLKCARPDVHAVLVSVPFGEGVTSVGTDAAALAAVQRARQIMVDENGPNVRVSVRGHADAGEADAERVARERAESVAAYLIGAGMPKANVEVRSYGSKLPVSRESKANRRVDFQVLTKER